MSDYSNSAMYPALANCSAGTYTNFLSLTVRCIAALCIALLSACKSLPTLNPDMAMNSNKKVQIQGSKGPLSHAQSQKIINALKKNAGKETSIFDHHLALEESINGTPLVLGNQVDLLIDGEATYDAMFKAIQQAKDHINMETFVLDNDAIGYKFADALIAKQREGVQVNLIYDSVGTLYTPQHFFDRMRANGINLVEFNPIKPSEVSQLLKLNQRDHRKLLIVDGEVAFVGGVNISSVYSEGSSTGAYISQRGDPDDDHVFSGPIPWRDTHIRLTGPVVNDFQRMFLATWENQKGEPLAKRNYLPTLAKRGEQVVRAIGSSPQDEFSLIYVTLLSAINSAATHVYLTNAYFVPDPQFLQSLKDAVARGVDVKLILPSKTDSNLVFYASRSYYTELLEAGVEIYEEQQSLLHAKTALVDGVWSTVGSTNLDWRSFLHNHEINAVILGKQFGDQMHAMFMKDLASSKRIRLEDWEKRPNAMKIKERAARLWAYWL